MTFSCSCPHHTLCSFGLLACAAVLLTVTVATAAGQTPTSGKVAGPATSMGSLAILANTAGTLFVDDARKTAISAGKITTLRVPAGEHFVDLRDDKGTKLWDRIVTIPANSQVAEKIEIRHSAGSRMRPLEPDDLSTLGRWKEYEAVRKPVAWPNLEGAQYRESERRIEESKKQQFAYATKACDESVSKGLPKDALRATFFISCLYGAGRFDEALRSASGALEPLRQEYEEKGVASARTRDDDSQAIKDLQKTFADMWEYTLADLFELRARIKFALLDSGGALDDLGESLVHASRLKASTADGCN